MNKILSLLIFSFLSVTNVFSQGSNVIHTSDIDNFWMAYDSIISTNNPEKKIEFIQNLYIKKGSKGLKAFMKARSYTDTLWVELINEYPKFWNSIRANTLAVKEKTAEIQIAVNRFKMIYPELKPAEMYFTIGGLRSGGTISENMVLVGCEIATGIPTTDVSEFENDWLKNIFSKQSLDNIVSLNIHEYVHTQQIGDRNRVLSQSIKEGSCDFITELVLESPKNSQYMIYGKQNYEQVKSQFLKEMFFNDFSNWLYNGTQKGESADMGYYIGYEICKAYYNQTDDKKRAIKEIIELNYDDDKAVEQFLAKSKFYSFPIDKNKIIKEYQAKLPKIVKLEPFKNRSKKVNNDLKELKIVFSEEMDEKAISISFSKKGKEFFPLVGLKGFENNGKTLVLNIDLKPNKEYEFVVTNKNFKSKQGYKLNTEEYIVKFKTK
jgi:hypothetical protein